jgi:DNA invertase Pin-like site-specific DNA recombinase
MTTAFGYIRTSGPSQTNGDGPERQRLAITEYAAAHDIEIVRIFQDKAVSGTTEWESRPAWMEMLTSLNGARTIIIERLDRLARDLIVSEHIIANLRSRDITLISTCEEDVDSDNPTRVLMRQILSAIAAFDKTMIVLKTRAARERIRATGKKCEGAHAFGRHPDKPEEVRVLELMRGLRSGGMSTPEIAAALNRNGLGTRHDGGRWFGSSVGRILRASAGN